jgi:hypothetical protein
MLVWFDANSGVDQRFVRNDVTLPSRSLKGGNRSGWGDEDCGPGMRRRRRAQSGRVFARTVLLRFAISSPLPRTSWICCFMMSSGRCYVTTVALAQIIDLARAGSSHVDRLGRILKMCAERKADISSFFLSFGTHEPNMGTIAPRARLILKAKRVLD